MIKWHKFGGVAACVMLIGCQPNKQAPAIAEIEATQASAVVWAVNVGGPAYSAVDGTRFAAEESVQGGERSFIATMKGSQDPALYQTYRAGDVQVARELANGRYDVTFYFAEPDEVDSGARVFDAYAEGKRVLQDLDVMLFRDGKVKSALSVTVPNVVVTDSQLDINFKASAGQPILSGLLVRKVIPRAKDFELVWADEFDVAGAPNPKFWNIEQWPARKVNDEDQTYTARSKNVRVLDGHLVLEAHREDYNDAKFTSGRIQSSGKADFLYGRFEVRAKLPHGQGTWPAIWMLPSEPFTYATNCSGDHDWQGDDDCDAWPNSGEIDIMEHVGYQMNHIHGTVHNKAYYWVKWEQRKGRIVLNDASEAFHVYAMEWSPERIDVFVDDALYFTYLNEHSGWEEWPFDKPFHLIMNLAVGGAWGRSGGPIDESVFPQRLVIDYARAYQRKKN